MLLVLGLLLTRAARCPQRDVLLSGLGFLVVSGLTGLAYVVAYLRPGLAIPRQEVLWLHATVALFGWNLSGLFVIVRWADFPLARRTGPLVALHWATMVVLLPLSRVEPVVALAAVPGAALVIVGMFLTGPARARAGAPLPAPRREPTPSGWLPSPRPAPGVETRGRNDRSARSHI